MEKFKSLGCLVYFCFVLFSLPSEAEVFEPYLIQDLNTDREMAEVCSDIVELAGIAYFCGRTVDNMGLWRSDGTEAGTYVIKRFSDGSRQLSPSALTSIEGQVFFRADLPGLPFSRGLWKSDGTEAGTVVVKDVTLLSNIVKMGSGLYFFGVSGTELKGLWRTDGSESGTTLVPQVPGLRIASSKLVVNNGEIYFVAEDATHGNELWKSDGTLEGTVMVRDVYSGNQDSIHATDYENIVALNNYVLFVATDGIDVQRLWKTDGTDAGTTVVKGVGANAFPDYPSQLSPEFNGYSYFLASGKFWRTDGSENGTAVFGDFKSCTYADAYHNYAFSAGKMYFVACSSSGFDERIWETDGLNSQMVMDAQAGGQGQRRVYSFFADQENVYFTVKTIVDGHYTLWKYDTNTGESTALKNIGWGDGFSAVGLNGKFIFKGGWGRRSGRLWVTDGSAMGTNVVKEINDHSKDTTFGELSDFKNELVFSADVESDGLELWKSKGDANSTRLVSDIYMGYGGSNPEDFITVNGLLFFTAMSSYGRELWKSDGTLEGTMLVKDISNDIGSSDPKGLFELNGILYFSANDFEHGRELWRSDGTEAGTYMVADIYKGYRNSGFSNEFADLAEYNDFVSIDGYIFFAATDGIHGEELWKSDGTAEGTVQVKDINPVIFDGANLGSYPLGIAKANGIVYFTAFTFDYGFELWRSDGTRKGTFLVKDIRPGFDADGFPLGSEPVGLFEFSGKLIFYAYTDRYGYEMWVSRGSNVNTRLLQDINPGNESSYGLVFGRDFKEGQIEALRDVAILGDSMYFYARNGVDARNLWKTKGIPSDVIAVQGLDIERAFTFRPSNFTVVGDEFYFLSGGPNSNRLWMSDGTSGNTGEIAYRGELGVLTSADSLVYAVDRLFFTADDGVKGIELWALLMDSDKDGFSNDEDNCVFDANPLQGNNDMDETGDICDADDDNDGFPDINDAFPFDETEWLDTDLDGLGNNMDLDDDNDGVPDIDPLTLLLLDNCPLIKNPLQRDVDEDGVGDACDLDGLCFPVRASSGAVTLICL